MLPLWSFRDPAVSRLRRGETMVPRLRVVIFLIFLDADCVIPESDRFFTKALSQFARNPNLVALTANLRVFPAAETFRRQGRTWRGQFRPTAKEQSVQTRRIVWRISDDPTGGVRAVGRISRRPQYDRGRRHIPSPVQNRQNDDRPAVDGIAYWPSRASGRLAALDRHVACQLFFVSVYGRSFTREWTAIC